jgi:hypothetical protein
MDEDLEIAFFKKDRSTPTIEVDYVMRKNGNHDAGKAGHKELDNTGDGYPHSLLFFCTR